MKPFIVLDIETNGLDRNKDDLLGVGISFDDEEVYMTPEEFRDFVDGGWLTAPSIVMHNMAFDVNFLLAKGIDVRGYEIRDTMLLSHLIDENRDSHSLDSLIQERWQDDYKEKFWAKHDSFQDAPKDEAEAYALADVKYTRMLYIEFLERLIKEQIPESLVDHVHRLARTLMDTEFRGVAVDIDYLMNMGVKLKTRIEELRPQMRASARDEVELIESQMWLAELEKRKTAKGKANVPKPEFNFESNRQLQMLYYGVLGLPVQKNEKTKQPSVDFDSLERIKDKHPSIAVLQEFRELNKVQTTYIDGITERLSDGRIYPSFNVNGTKTGRISHREPNLGNMPRSGGIRGLFIPSPGSVFISSDYSQLEVCLSAHFTRDPSLLKIVLEGASQHDITATALGIDRQRAKSVNFSCQYGASHYKLAKILEVSEKEGKRAHDKYWETYAGQKRLMDECARKVDAGTPIVNTFGRKRRFEKKARNPWDKAYRQAWNALVQGTGADITSRALYLIDEELKRLGWGHALFSIHDECLIEVKQEHAAEAEALMRRVMVGIGEEIGLTVPLRVETSGACARWED